MDSVPFAFCDSVCAVLGDLDAINELSQHCGTWKTAVRKNAHNRDFFHVCVGFQDGEWCYRITNQGQRMSFEELKKLNRKHLHVNSVKLTTQWCREADESSFEEIGEIARFTAPFVNMATMSVNLYDHQFLSLYMNVSCGKLQFTGYSNYMDEFLINQLESGLVKNLTIVESPREYVYTPPLVEEFLLSSQYECVQIICPGAPFSRTFLEQLLARPFSLGRSQIDAYFFCRLDDLRSVNRGQQVAFDEKNKQMTWRREDGVQITVRNPGPYFTIVMEKHLS